MERRALADIARTCHAHLTCSEAALACGDGAIHA